MRLQSNVRTSVLERRIQTRNKLNKEFFFRTQHSRQFLSISTYKALLKYYNNRCILFDSIFICRKLPVQRSKPDNLLYFLNHKKNIKIQSFISGNQRKDKYDTPLHIHHHLLPSLRGLMITNKNIKNFTEKCIIVFNINISIVVVG